MNTLRAQLQNALSGIPGLKLAFLFGSRAHGEPRPDSDIDLGVLADKPLSTAQRIDLIERVAQVTGLPVDLVDLHGEPEPILGEVLRGVRLLGSSEEFAQLLYRHVVSVADFLPLRERILRERRNAWIGWCWTRSSSRWRLSSGPLRRTGIEIQPTCRGHGPLLHRKHRRGHGPLLRGRFVAGMARSYGEGGAGVTCDTPDVGAGHARDTNHRARDAAVYLATATSHPATAPADQPNCIPAIYAKLNAGPIVPPPPP